MLLKEITSYLESLFPLSNQESYDNSGLIIGNPDQEIEKLLICVDVTIEVINEAIEKNCNLIISHHPLIFSGIKKIIYCNSDENPVVKAIQNNISIYAAHTNLDNGKNGINKVLGEKLGLINTSPLLSGNNMLRKLVVFCPLKSADNIRSEIFKAGAGHIGNYDCCSYNIEGFGTFRGNNDANPFVGKKGEIHHEKEVRIETIFPYFIEKKVINAMLAAHPYEEAAYDIYNVNNTYNGVGSGIVGELKKEIPDIEFLKKVKKILSVNSIRHTKTTGRNIKKVALCGGSGSFLIEQAIARNVDVFITADLKYHDYFLSNQNMILADFGHYETEQFAKELLFSLLTKKISTFAVLISEINTNPVHYL
jgi:dinuclear metal center YbgI/SA1388 family protein